MTSKTPDRDLQKIANDFLADIEAERIIDPSCTLASRLQDVRDAAAARAKAFAQGECCPGCGWPEGHCECNGEVTRRRPPLTHVACRDTEGRVWSLPRPFRHHHVLGVMRERGTKCAEDGHFNQGFLDADGRYLHRKAAFISAEANKQIKNGKIIGGVLTSEDLW